MPTSTTKNNNNNNDNNNNIIKNGVFYCISHDYIFFGVGKTHILYSWLLGHDAVVSTHPTLEFNVEKIITKDGRVFLVWDISGCERFRPKRRHFFEGTQGK